MTWQPSAPLSPRLTYKTSSGVYLPNGASCQRGPDLRNSPSLSHEAPWGGGWFSCICAIRAGWWPFCSPAAPWKLLTPAKARQPGTWLWGWDKRAWCLGSESQRGCPRVRERASGSCGDALPTKLHPTLQPARSPGDAGRAAPAKATELVRGEAAVTAALCWREHCPLNTCSPSLPLLLQLYLGKGFLIYRLCPTELNTSKLMIEGTTGDDAPQPVGSMSHFVALCKHLSLCFSIFFLSCVPVSPWMSRVGLLRQRHQSWAPDEGAGGRAGDRGLCVVCAEVQAAVTGQVPCLYAALPFMPAPGLLSRLKTPLGSRAD